MEVEILGGIPQKKNKQATLGIIRTKLRKRLTYFVNIHAHSSIKCTMRNSGVTGSIANKNEETAQYFFSLLLKRKNKTW